MDITMVDRKSTIAAPGRSKVNINLELDDADDAAVGRLPAQDIAVLSIADEQDTGGDPYNSTGVYCRVAKDDEPA